MYCAATIWPCAYTQQIEVFISFHYLNIICRPYCSKKTNTTGTTERNSVSVSLLYCMSSTV